MTKKGKLTFLPNRGEHLQFRVHVISNFRFDKIICYCTVDIMLYYIILYYSTLYCIIFILYCITLYIHLYHIVIYIQCNICIYGISTGKWPTIRSIAVEIWYAYGFVQNGEKRNHGRTKPTTFGGISSRGTRTYHYEHIVLVCHGLFKHEEAYVHFNWSATIPLVLVYLQWSPLVK